MRNYFGTWAVANPDRGNPLKPGELLLIGGAYQFLPDMSVAAVLDFRDAATRIHRRRLHGLGRAGRRGSILCCYADGISDCFHLSNDGFLYREQSSLPSVDMDVRLYRVPHEHMAAIPPIAPGMLFNTMPKSGSIYISNYLSNGLRLGQMKVATSLFPDDLVLRDRLDILAAGDVISQQHVPARDINLRFIAARIPNIVVHLRDPRQAMLSWVHHLNNFNQNRHERGCVLGLEATSPALPNGYFDWPFERKIDFQIEHHLAQLVEWTMGWVSTADSNPYGLAVHITTFERYVAAPRMTIEGILSFFGVPDSQFDWEAAPAKTPRTHFRRGLTEEWRSVFTAQQIEKSTQTVPAVLRDRFSWP